MAAYRVFAVGLCTHTDMSRKNFKGYMLNTVKATVPIPEYMWNTHQR